MVDSARKKEEFHHIVQSKMDRLEYMSDLLGELREMAHQNGLVTLEGILGLAQAEARLRARDGS